MTDQEKALERGVYRLAGAMLLQAINDVGSISQGRRKSALRWMRSGEDSLFSFEFVCRVLNRNPEEVRRFCERKLATRIRVTTPFAELLRSEHVWPASMSI